VSDKIYTNAISRSDRYGGGATFLPDAVRGGGRKEGEGRQGKGKKWEGGERFNAIISCVVAHGPHRVVRHTF
jgi:hypothetical protein